jgi:hypothetical protein
MFATQRNGVTEMRIPLSSIALACLMFGSLPAAQAKNRTPRTVKDLCRLTAPAPKQESNDQADDIVIYGWKQNEDRNVTIATCSANVRITLRDFRLRSSPDGKWSRNVLKIGKDQSGAPVGFVHFPGSADQCLYEVEMLFQGWSRHERYPVTREFNVCYYGSMVVFIDQIVAASKTQSLARAGTQ